MDRLDDLRITEVALHLPWRWEHLMPHKTYAVDIPSWHMDDSIYIRITLDGYAEVESGDSVSWVQASTPEGAFGQWRASKTIALDEVIGNRLLRWVRELADAASAKDPHSRHRAYRDAWVVLQSLADSTVHQALLAGHTSTEGMSLWQHGSRLFIIDTDSELQICEIMDRAQRFGASVAVRGLYPSFDVDGYIWL